MSSRADYVLEKSSQRSEGAADTAFSATCTVVTLSGLEVRGHGTRSTKKQAKVAAAFEALGFMKAVAAEFMRAVSPEPTSAQGGETGGGGVVTAVESAVGLNSQASSSEAGRNPVGVLKEMLDAKKVKSIVYDDVAAVPPAAAAGEKDSAAFSNTSKGMRQRLRRSRRRLEVINSNSCGSSSSDLAASSSSTAEGSSLAIAADDTASSYTQPSCQVCGKEVCVLFVAAAHTQEEELVYPSKGLQ